MPHAYTEDQLVEQPAIWLFAELGWTTVSALEKILGTSGTLQRSTSCSERPTLAVFAMEQISGRR